MLRISIQEYGRISRSQLSYSQQNELQRFDEHHAAASGDSVFDWSRRENIGAKNYVGVIQTSNVQIEILPKIDSIEEIGPEAFDFQKSRQNLLYMLSVSDQLPLHERDLAGLNAQRLPILEALVRVFVLRLLGELRKGQQHLYMHREQNLPYVKGRILMNRHLSRNAAHKHLTFVSFDEFQCDTWLNRILKATCQRLLRIIRSNRTQQYLREALLELGDATAYEIRYHHFEKVQLDRSSERFENLLNFCKLFYSRSTPAPFSGSNNTFSLLFPMETLFEEFVGRLIHRHATRFGFSREDVHLQASHRRRWLLRSDSGAGAFRLKPDVLVEADDGEPLLILDTKWKRLVSDNVDTRNGVSQADIYQLFAYSQRYKCHDNVLLFPWVAGVSPKCFSIDEIGRRTRIRIEFMKLDYDLRTNQESLLCDLQRAIQGSLSKESGDAVIDSTFQNTVND